MLLSSTVDQGSGRCSSFLFFFNRFCRVQAIEQCQHRTAVCFANIFALFDQNLEMQRSEILAQMSQKFDMTRRNFGEI